MKNCRVKRINKYKSKCTIGDKSIYITDWKAKERDNKKYLLKTRLLMSLFSSMMFMGILGLAGMAGNIELDIVLPFKQTVIMYAVFISMMLVGFFVMSRLHSNEDAILRRLKGIRERGDV